MKIYSILSNYLHTLSADKIEPFIHDVYTFIDQYPEYGFDRYQDILKANHIAWEKEAMQNINVSALDEKCIIALIVGAIRAERFYEGTLLCFFTDGTMEKWLLRLKDINGDICKESLDG